MFKERSDIQDLFKHFKDTKDLEDLRIDEMLEKHALIVMSTFDETVNNIDNVDYVFSLLKTTGSMHSRFPNFQSDLFWVSN